MFSNFNKLISVSSFVNWAPGVYRARTLLPGFSVHLHWEPFLCFDKDRCALGQPSTRGSETRSNLTHVKAVLQTYHLDQAITDIYKKVKIEYISSYFYMQR